MRRLLLLLHALRASASEGGLEELETAVRDPVEVGYERHVSGRDGGLLIMRTLSVDPPVFLLPGFLSSHEADEIVKIAKAQPEKSWSRSEVSTNFVDAQVLEDKSQAKEFVREADGDGDGYLDASEVAWITRELFQMPNFGEEDLDALAAHCGVAAVSEAVGKKKKKSKKRVPVKSFLASKPLRFFRRLLEREPYRLDRFSDQTWLKHTRKQPALQRVLNRTAEVTGLPLEVVEEVAEELQVVLYPERGHYACHHDSSPDSLDEGHVRLATLGMFLNDVPKGGATAFPGADRKETADWSEDQWAELEAECQLTPACTSLGGLVVPAKKGDGILWYNVRPAVIPGLVTEGVPKQREQGVFGPKTLLWSSMHCGAEVLEGQKWFANLWLHAPEEGLQQQQRKRRRGKREL